MPRKTTKQRSTKTKEQLMEELNALSGDAFEDDEEFDSEPEEEVDEEEEVEEQDDSDEEEEEEDSEEEEDDPDDEDEEDGEAEYPAQVAFRQEIVAVGAAEAEVNTSSQVGDGPPPDGFQDLRPRVRVNMAVRSEVLAEDLTGQWHWGDDEILEKVEKKLNQWQELVPGKGASLRVYLSVLYHTGGRPLEAEDACVRSTFFDTMMEMARELDERYRFNVSSRDPHFRPKEEEEPETPPATMQEKLMASMAVFSKAQGAAAAINEIHAASRQEAATTGGSTSFIKYLAHPAVQALFDDDEAVKKVSELVGMESVVNVLKAVGGPIANISMAIELMKRTGGI